jgi:FHA domain-containing protein
LILGEVVKADLIMQSQFNLNEQENFEERGTVRGKSKVTINASLSEEAELSRKPRNRQGDGHLARSAWDGGKCDDELRTQGSKKFPHIPLIHNPKITISVIEGPSKGLAYKLSKLCITVGRIGGGADFEFDEPEASSVQCIVAACVYGVRLYDGASVSGTYVNGLRISTVELTHMSTFRIGSSLLLVSILPANTRTSGECARWVL